MKKMIYFTSLFLVLFASCVKPEGWTEPVIVEPPPVEVEPTYPPLTDAEILDRVQRESLKYFWDFAETNSK